MAKTETITETIEESTTEHARGWVVVVQNDDDHSFDYVIVVFCKVLLVSVDEALRLAFEIDGNGEAVVAGPMSKYEAASVAKALSSYGPDPAMADYLEKNNRPREGLLASIREA